MKKFLSTTAIVGTLFAIAAGSAMADASSGDIKLNGTMCAICVVDVDAKNTDIHAVISCDASLNISIASFDTRVERNNG